MTYSFRFTIKSVSRDIFLVDVKQEYKDRIVNGFFDSGNASVRILIQGRQPGTTYMQTFLLNMDDVCDISYCALSEESNEQ